MNIYLVRDKHLHMYMERTNAEYNFDLSPDYTFSLFRTEKAATKAIKQFYRDIEKYPSMETGIEGIPELEVVRMRLVPKDD